MLHAFRVLRNRLFTCVFVYADTRNTDGPWTACRIFSALMCQHGQHDGQERQKVGVYMFKGRVLSLFCLFKTHRAEYWWAIFVLQTVPHQRPFSQAGRMCPLPLWECWRWLCAGEGFMVNAVLLKAMLTQGWRECVDYALGCGLGFIDGRLSIMLKLGLWFKLQAVHIGLCQVKCYPVDCGKYLG